MFKKLFFIALTLGLGLYSTESSAQIFDLEITNYNGADSVPALKTLIDTQIQTIEDDLNADIPNTSPERLMEGMANSSAMSTKGVGTDYASNMDVFLIGGGVGVGADLTKDEQTGGDISGAGIAPGVIIGTNLGWLKRPRLLGLHTNRLNVYLNFMNYNHHQPINDKTGEESSVDVDMLTMGVHFRYDLVQKRGNKLFGWGGIKVHLGYDYNKTDINFKSTFNKDITGEVSGSGETVSGTVTGTPEANILVKTGSIPLEISTDIQLLYFLSIYTGLGADMNWGTAEGKATANADESTLNCTGGAACAAPRTINVQTRANINSKGNVDPYFSRAFAGVQLNLPWTRIFVQANKAFGTNLYSATAGLRFAF